MRFFHCIKYLLFPALLLLVVGLLKAQEVPAVEYLRYDVDITVEESGDFLVRETQRVRYGEAFSEGFAEIPLDYVTDVKDISLFGGPNFDQLNAYELNGSGPNTFSVQEEGSTLYVDWQYELTEPGDELTFVVEYLVEGGLWIYPEADTLEWRAVPEDRGGLDVPESEVTVNFPFAVDSNELMLDAFGPTFSTVSETDGGGTQVIFTADEPIPDGLPFQILLDFPHGLVASVPQAWQLAADDEELVYRIPAVEVSLTLDETGDLHVSEWQHVRVVEGSMYEGFRPFTWLFLEGLDRLYVSEGDVSFNHIEQSGALACEDCFHLASENRYSSWAYYDRTHDEVAINDYAAGGAEVTWRFPPLVKGEEAAFHLEYDAVGTVSINENDQRLYWTILPGYDVPVEKSTVRLTLPNRLGLEDVLIEGAGTQQTEDGTILLTLDEPATDWSIQVTLPAGTTSAKKPAWQSELEAVTVEAQAYRQRLAREKLIIGVVGLLTLALVLLGALAAWYLKGSRKWQEMRGNYRSTPPSELAPGLVAYLVDEKPTSKGALATLLHLATLGLIRVDIDESMQLERISDEEHLKDDTQVRTPVGHTAQVTPHIAFLYNSLTQSLPVGTAVPLDKLLGVVKSLLPGLYARMGRDLAVRYHEQGGLHRSHRLPRRVFFGALALFFVLIIFAGPVWNALFITPLSSAPLIVVMVIFLFGSLAWWIISSLQIKSLSQSAAKEAKRWLGFKAYLQDIQQYGDLAEAQEILDRYFDYAVALDVDERLLRQVQAMGGFIPLWIGRTMLDDGTAPPGPTPLPRPWYVRPWYQRGSWTGRPSQTAVPVSRTRPSSDKRPALQRMSADLTGSLNEASRSLTAVLNTAVGESTDPVKVKISAFGSSNELEWDPDTPLDQVIGDVMRKSETLRPPRRTRTSAGYRGSRGSGSRIRSRSSGRSRSSSSRRSGGGGRRGFR